MDLQIFQFVVGRVGAIEKVQTELYIIELRSTTDPNGPLLNAPESGGEQGTNGKKKERKKLLWER